MQDRGGVLTKEASAELEKCRQGLKKSKKRPPQCN